MKEYDAIVIGSGCGMNIVLEALAHNWKVALVDGGPLGGTCPNNGCIPSRTHGTNAKNAGKSGRGEGVRVP